MAFDWGLKRIGVAVGNTLLATCEPLCVLNARDGVPNWAAIAELFKEWQPEQLVVGDPLNMDDRLTSREARIQLEEQGLPYHGAVDAHAAQLILQSWLAEQAER